MTALAEAVMPIMRLLVAVATRSGTPIAEVHQRDLDDPAADAEQRRGDAGAVAPTTPSPTMPDAVAGPSSRTPIEAWRLAGVRAAVDLGVAARPSDAARPRAIVIAT